MLDHAAQSVAHLTAELGVPNLIPRLTTYFRDHEIFSAVASPLLLIQEGHFSVAGKCRCTWY